MTTGELFRPEDVSLLLSLRLAVFLTSDDTGSSPSEEELPSFYMKHHTYLSERADYILMLLSKEN
jgi:hypothetical protein